MSATSLPSPGDRQRLTELELTIERGRDTFVAVGQALLEIQSKKLYRENFRTFEAYCRERWGFSRQRAYQLTAGARVAGQIGRPIPESHARQLARVPESARANAYEQLSGEEEPATADDLAAILDELPADELERAADQELLERKRAIQAGGSKARRRILKHLGAIERLTMKLGSFEGLEKFREALKLLARLRAEYVA